MNIKEQIRAEIERRLSWRITLEARAAYNNILRFLDTLPEQPVEGLEEKDFVEEVRQYYSNNCTWDALKQPMLSIITRCARHFAEWGMNQCPLPENTTIFQKGVAEGRRLEKDDNISLIESRIGEILGDAQPAPVLRAELRELINKIKEQ